MSSNYPQSLTCSKRGCFEPTRERKPYCTEHVNELPYVQSVLAKIEERDRELAAVAKRGFRAVDPEGLNAAEILLQLSLFGERTVPRLCRDLQLELDVAEGFAYALARRGMVTLGHTSRGHAKLELAPAGQAALHRFQNNERAETHEVAESAA